MFIVSLGGDDDDGFYGPFKDRLAAEKWAESMRGDSDFEHEFRVVELFSTDSPWLQG